MTTEHSYHITKCISTTIQTRGTCPHSLVQWHFRVGKKCSYGS